MSLYRRIEIQAHWDSSVGLWRASNVELPYNDAAPTYDQLAKNLLAASESIRAGFVWARGVNVDIVMIPCRVRVLAGIL